MKILVLGGYGNFGARICRALVSDVLIDLLIAGRVQSRAESFAAELGSAKGVAVDCMSPEFPDLLRRLGVELVVHTAGPFQQQSYAVAQAAAAAGAHYIDLADGRRFVCDFPAAMDVAFRDVGRTAISGASTVPALSSAAVEHLCNAWQRIDSIDICIAPAQTAPRGKATLAAVLGYCGERIRVWDEGRWQFQRGWSHPQRVQFARLRPRLGALCDIPDLELFPEYFHTTQRVMFTAALEVGITQRAFAMLAALRSAGIVPPLTRLAGLLNFTARVFDGLGSSLGGMVVRTRGLDSLGRTVARAWHIAADNDHGPEIPCMAAILLARRLACGEKFPAGAHTCMGLLKLDEFAPAFARWGMLTDTFDEPSDAVSQAGASLETQPR